MTLRAAASTDSHVAPSCAAAKAASCARFSTSQTSRWRCVGLPNTPVRVMSDTYPSTVHPASTSTTSPSRSFCGCTLPCGNAEYLPKVTNAPSELPPALRVSLATIAPTSPVDMPSLSDANAVPIAFSVMSFACCISAISAADLIMRPPAVTGVALTNCDDGSSCRSPS